MAKWLQYISCYRGRNVQLPGIIALLISEKDMKSCRTVALCNFLGFWLKLYGFHCARNFYCDLHSWVTASGYQHMSQTVECARCKTFDKDGLQKMNVSLSMLLYSNFCKKTMSNTFCNMHKLQCVVIQILSWLTDAINVNLSAHLSTVSGCPVSIKCGCQQQTLVSL